MGFAQAVGGGTEAVSGFTLATGGTAGTGGLGAALTIGGGTYLMVDGSSNVTGGFSRMYNGWNSSTAGDTLNFVKNGYTALSPQYGGQAYYATQVGIGVFSLGKGGLELYNGYSTATTAAGAYSVVGGAATTTSWR